MGRGKETSFNRIIEELNKQLGTRLEPEYIENPYAHYQPATLADISNTQKFLGYEPGYDIAKGIADYVQFLRRNNL